MKKIFFLISSMVCLFAEENTPQEYGLLAYGQLLIIVLLLGYIVVSKLHIFEKWKQRKKQNHFSPLKIDTSAEETSMEVIEKYRVEMRKIKIERQPFRLSGLLHILTNKMSELLKKHKHTIYYDVQSEVGRYIIGDNDYIEQVLEILLKNSIVLNTDSEISIKISKIKNKFLVFEVINQTGFMQKSILKEYRYAERTSTDMTENINAFIKAKKIAEAMGGSITVKSTKRSGTHYIFQTPYYKDKDNISHQEALKKFLDGKQALFIGKDKYDTKRAQYIFKTFGLHIGNMTLADFGNKKPDLKKYDMAILRSSDLTPAHISFFKNIYQDKNSNFKIIIVHEMFESEESMALSKSIAHAELYNPTIIGDVEEILYQMFILQSNAVKGINNMEVFDPNAFALKGNNTFEDDGFEKYKGAHIAIVEDSKVDQRIMKNILNIDGLSVFSMNNGAEMIDLLEKEEIDLIFSDINMPVMDGLTMTKKIRKRKEWKDIPIVSISSMAFVQEIKEMQIAGMNASISKPIVPEEVYRALERFLIITPKIQDRGIKLSQEEQQSQEEAQPQKELEYDKKVLDIGQGLEEAGSDIQYQDILLETMEMLKETMDPFVKMIYDQQYHALGDFSQSVLTLYENIHAPEMIKMFKELIQFLSEEKRTYLTEYVFIYQKNWKRLQSEVEKYLAHIADTQE